MGRFTASVSGLTMGEGDVMRSGRARVLLGVALGPIVTGYAVVASLLVLVAALAPRSEFSAGGVLAAACPAWLAAYQVPLDIGGAPLGVLPMLPTLGAVLLVFRTAASAVRRLDEAASRRSGRLSRAASVVGTVVVAHALFAVVAVGVAAGSAVEGRLPEAILTPTVLAGGAAASGAAFVTSANWSKRLDPVAVRGMRAGLIGFGALFAVGTLLFLGATLAEWSTLGELFSAYSPDAGSAVGMLLLSLGYVPNATVLAASVLTGGGFVIGEVSVSALAMTPGPVPAVPVLAGLPAEYGAWWPLLLVVPAVIGVGVGWSLREVDRRLSARLRAVFVAGTVCGFCAVVVAAFAGGALGGGAYDPVAVRVELFSLAAFAFVVVPGGVVAWLTGSGRKPRRTPRR